MAAPTLPVTPSGISTSYQQLVLEHLRLVNSAYAAVAYLNMGEFSKAQDALQGAIADVEGSH